MVKLQISYQIISDGLRIRDLIPARPGVIVSHLPRMYRSTDIQYLLSIWGGLQQIGDMLTLDNGERCLLADPMTMDLKEVEFLFYALTSEERVFDPAIVCNKEG